MVEDTESFPDHDDPTTWVELTGEETRCLLGLKSYYVIFGDRTDNIALELAWIDLKREFPRLELYTWYRCL